MRSVSSRNDLGSSKARQRAHSTNGGQGKSFAGARIPQSEDGGETLASENVRPLRKVEDEENHFPERGFPRARTNTKTLVPKKVDHAKELERECDDRERTEKNCLID